jgi:type I restriction enzyme, S subunit
MASISQGQLSDFPIVLTGLDQQRRIVAEIEKQFSRLDEAVANLKRVKANLKRFEEALLLAAVDGTLSGHGPSATPRRLNSGDRLPEGWTWTSAAALAMDEPGSIGAGPFGTIFKAKDFRPEGVPIIFLRHVGPMKYLRDKPGFMDRGKWEELFRPYSVFGGELLITKLGEPPGVCAAYPTGIGPAMVTPDVIKMSVDPTRVSSKFLMYYFNSQVARRFATGAAFGTTRTRLTLPLFRQMPVVLPPVTEQLRIVAEVDRRLSIVREVETEVDANLKRAQALRQAVLARAFAGADEAVLSPA